MSKQNNRRWQAMMDAVQSGTANDKRTPGARLVRGAEDNLIGGIVSLLRHDANMRQT